MVADTFGSLLRAARKRAGFKTIASFAEALSERGAIYDEGAIGHWENNRRSPYQQSANRALVLTIFSVLAQHGGVTNPTEVDAMLDALARPRLTDEERSALFPLFAAAPEIANLPEKPAYHRLIGRESAVEAISAKLLDPSGSHVVAISGLGGIGKTAVAYEVLLQVMRSGRFEKLAWETAKSETFTGVGIQRQREQNISLSEVLVAYACQLGFEGLATLPATELRARLRSILQTGSYLLVLDNIETLEAAHEVARFLYGLVSSGKSRVLITSRERLAEEAYVHDHYLPALPLPDALALLLDEATSRNADTVLQADDSLREKICRTTGGMPLAIKLIVSQSLLGVALDEELDRLEGVMDERDLYTFIYFVLWRKLSKPGRKLLMSAAAFPTAAFRSLLQPVSEQDDAVFGTAAAELVKACLIEVSNHPLAAQKRYETHAMTRWFINGPLTDLWNNQ